MTIANKKILLIKKLLNQIEDECEFSLLLYESLLFDSNTKRKINPEIIDMLQVYFDVIKYIMNMTDVPNNIHNICICLTNHYKLLRVEFYSTNFPTELNKFDIDVKWVDN